VPSKCPAPPRNAGDPLEKYLPLILANPHIPVASSSARDTPPTFVDGHHTAADQGKAARTDLRRRLYRGEFRHKPRRRPYAPAAGWQIQSIKRAYGAVPRKGEARPSLSSLRFLCSDPPGPYRCASVRPLTVPFAAAHRHAGADRAGGPACSRRLLGRLGGRVARACTTAAYSRVYTDKADASAVAEFQGSAINHSGDWVNRLTGDQGPWHSSACRGAAKQPGNIKKGARRSAFLAIALAANHLARGLANGILTWS